MLAAMKTDRSSIGIEIDSTYCQLAMKRLQRESADFFREVQVQLIEAQNSAALAEGFICNRAA